MECAWMCLLGMWLFFGTCLQTVLIATVGKKAADAVTDPLFDFDDRQEIDWSSIDADVWASMDLEARQKYRAKKRAERKSRTNDPRRNS